MKQLYTITLMLLIALHLFAQHEPIQPYEDLGIKVKVLTLSNGKYQESFPNDTLHRIGSVLFNRVTGEVETVVIDTTLGEYSFRADVPSRWLSPDPLAAKFPEWSPYTGMNDNPVMFIDPDGRRVIIPTMSEANILVADLNRTYEDKYGFKNTFKVTTKTFNVKKKNENYRWYKPWTWEEEPEYFTVKEERILIETNNQFDWNTDIYTKAMFDVVNTTADVFVDIVPDEGVIVQQTLPRSDSDLGLLEGRGGGHAVNSQYVILSDILSETKVGADNSWVWTFGHVALHELLYHIHPLGYDDEKTVDGANTMRIYYGGKSGGTHDSGYKKNKTLSDKDEQKRLEKLRSQTGKKDKS